MPKVGAILEIILEIFFQNSRIICRIAPPSPDFIGNSTAAFYILGNEEKKKKKGRGRKGGKGKEKKDNKTNENENKRIGFLWCKLLTNRLSDPKKFKNYVNNSLFESFFN